MSRPFLRWAGGKQKLVNSLLPFTPSQHLFGTYIEPFVGGGSLFFALSPRKAIIADINEELIKCYKTVESEPDKVFRALKRFAEQDSREFYYQTRSRMGKQLSEVQQAARFIYMNKAAFNGIFRVNKKGQFNVPYGPSRLGRPAIPTFENLNAAAECLRKAKILGGDFEKVLTRARKDDFIYLDPPYPPSSKTAYFAHYSPIKFSWDDQQRLARLVHEMDKRGCLIMMSNADQERVSDLYAGLRNARTTKLNAIRWIGSNGDRFAAREIIITNYNPKELNR
jgi:DNA adenine methylase